MVQDLLKKARRLRAPHVLAAAFLLYIGFVALYPLAQLLDCTKALVRDEMSPADYIESVDELYYGMLSTEQDQPLLQNKGTYIDLNGAMARLMGQPMMNERVTLKNGHLSHVVSWRSTPEEIEFTAQNITALARKQASQGRQFLFVLTPAQISKYEDLLPAGYTDTTNETADALLALLAQNGVPCLDLREQMWAENITNAEAFFVTDHHWKPQTGFWAYTKILDTLEAMGAIGSVDSFYTDSGQYEFVTYPDTFLGSSGKRTGIYYAGVDDSIFIQPRFDTEISLTIPEREVDLTGRYEDVCYNTEDEVHLDDPDFFQYSAYSLYGWGDNGLNQWRNEQAPDSSKVMLIGDSFGNIPFSLMSLYFSSCEELDMRYYSGDFGAHYKDFQPDIVILEATLDQVIAENTTYAFCREDP
ncbi:MAG: hypothetical protein Q4F81_12730 [Eubacteriales bacterium]|nr:hypothetical protein [Eubacteriales bacterium]